MGGGNLVKDRWEKAATEHSTSSRISRSLASIAVNADPIGTTNLFSKYCFLWCILSRRWDSQYSAMVAAVLLSSRTLAPLAQIANLFGRFNNARTAYYRLSEFMEETKELDEKEKDNSTVRRPELNDLEFKSLSFRYPGKQVDTLEQLNLKVTKGEKIAILGRNGSGKTTVIKLASGLFQATDGLVMYDGIDTQQINNEDLSRSIGIVLQDVQLFSGSVYENITMGREGITMEDVVEASKIAGLDEFLGKMPGGYELVLQDKGNGLSGGQKQAIAITRAIVHKPSHFILDEPTSAMDMNSELNFINNFKEVVKDSSYCSFSSNAFAKFSG